MLPDAETENRISLIDETEMDRRASRADPYLSRVWELLTQVKDPEIPVLSIEDLGILRNVNIEGDVLVVSITPTYSGCPAMNMIAQDIKALLTREGYSSARVDTCLAPAWTTDWLSESGRQKLAAYGIAPPSRRNERGDTSSADAIEVTCPQCHSLDTKLISEFGSTACKALYQCNRCLEPFDYFKCH